MARQTIIPLIPPLEGHEGPIKRVVLREPTFDEYERLGDPVIIAQTTMGAPFVVENADIIRQYTELCLVEPDTPALLRQGGMRLAKKIRAGVLDFFREGDAASEDSPTSPQS